ncbi:MAG: nitroreductase family protein [Pseudomonadota bacterium]
MDVLEAIKTRKSIRRFTDQPVPRETLDEILRISQQSPSGTNTQPWHTHVCTGAVKEALSQDVLAMAASGQGKSYEELSYYPDKWNPDHQARRRGVGWGLYGLLGIEKGDREGSARQGARNFVFFDAPVGIFVTTERYLMNGSWADAGMYIQTIMLAAKGFGLDTCPQAAWVPFSDAVYKHLQIPEDQVLVSGMSLGYADPDAIENTLVSDREAVEDVATYHGFG